MSSGLALTGESGKCNPVSVVHNADHINVSNPAHLHHAIKHKAGFVERTRSPFGAVLIVSLGTMERVYGDVIREARREASSR